MDRLQMDRLQIRTDWFDVPAPLPFPGPDAPERGNSALGRADRPAPGRGVQSGRVPGRGAGGSARRGDPIAAVEAALNRAQSSLDRLNELAKEDERGLAPLPFRPFGMEIDPDDGPRAA